LGSSCGIHLGWATRRLVAGREGRLLRLIAPFQGRKIGAHFGAHLNNKRPLLAAIGKVAKANGSRMNIG
jgi:hypothetical protein